MAGICARRHVCPQDQLDGFNLADCLFCHGPGLARAVFGSQPLGTCEAGFRCIATASISTRLEMKQSSGCRALRAREQPSSPEEFIKLPQMIVFFGLQMRNTFLESTR